MTDRIQRLATKTVNGEIWVESIHPEFDRCDVFLDPDIMNAKRSAEYILAQKPFITEDTALTGYLRFDDDRVFGDIFGRSGHPNFAMHRPFYNAPVDELCTFEWQHSVADFNKVLKIGIQGFKDEIAASRQKNTDEKSKIFLDGVDRIADAIIGWANKCADEAQALAKNASSDEAKTRLNKLATALRRVPEHPAESFYEAVLSVYIIYAFVPDSIGTIDRFFYPFYVKDIANGTLTVDEAKEYLQELFLMLQFRVSIKSDRFYRGGESHFCVGGYLPDGSDGFNELSRLIIDAMLELPTYIPQISLRWTKKTPPEVLRYAMDCERKDPNKRIAFVNDEPRIKALMEIAGFSYELACGYTMVGCNEPQLPGGIYMGGCDLNYPKCIEWMLLNRIDDLKKATDFDQVYEIFEQEHSKMLDKAVEWYEKFQSLRARDTNFVSTMFFEGSIERAKSITQGGAKNAIATLGAIGITTVIDSLTAIKQHVFDEKTFTIEQLHDALVKNWQGYEQMRSHILRTTNFFGNNHELSDSIAKRVATSMAEYFAPKRSKYGYNFLLGNLIGYNQHNKFFGELLMATPDGRYKGDAISFGIGQTDGKDREGLSSLLISVAKLNQNLILCGSTVTNILLEEQLIKNDANFEKLVKLFETYFKLGGLHFQLNYISRHDLLNAQKEPEKYRSLRVRVSGFSDYFRLLNEDLQDDIIRRTEVKG